MWWINQATSILSLHKLKGHQHLNAKQIHARI